MSYELKDIEKVENALEQLQNLKQQSLAKREVLRENLKVCNEELKKYNINPKEVDKEINIRTEKINSILSEINDLIPWDLVSVNNDEVNTDKVADMPF